MLLKAKGWDVGVRLLDQFELMNDRPGAKCVMQVMSYETGKWLLCVIHGRNIYSLAHWYRLLRSELGWDRAVRVAVAAK